MSPRTESEFEKLRLERKNQIMDKALELFAKEGFHQVTVSRIAEHAGISKGLVYNYFESKEALLQEIITTGMNMLMESFDSNKDGTLTNEEFEFFVDEVFNMLSNNQQFFKLYISVLTQPEALRLVKDKFEAFYEFFIQMLTQYFISVGSHNPEAEARVFGATTDGIMYHFLFLKDYPLEEVKKTIINRYKKSIS